MNCFIANAKWRVTLFLEHVFTAGRHQMNTTESCRGKTITF